MVGENEEVKIIIFGTGNYYQKYKPYINNKDIICFADNNAMKHGTILDGKKILNPAEIDFSASDYIIVLIEKMNPIVEQLISMGVEEWKIKSFLDLGELFNLDAEVYGKNGKNTFSDWCKQYSSKKVLIVSHVLQRSGVPVALMHMSVLLQKMGFHVVLASLEGGALSEELMECNIDYIPSISMYYRSKKFLEIVAEMDFVILGTIVLSEVGKYISHVDVPIIWWIHESEKKYYLEHPLVDKKNIYYYAGGQRVVECFKKYYPNVRIEKLLYYLPGCECSRYRTDKIHIGMIGTIEKRKAQDVFIRALEQIPKEKKDGVSFEIVGVLTEKYIDIEKELAENSQLHYLGEFNQTELKRYFETLDLLVCPSRDDPMPIVVTQAMQYGVPCIISNQVGQMEYIKNGENGYVFETENVEELSDILEFCIEHFEILPYMGMQAKKIYEEYFSEKRMRDNISDILEKIM